MPPRRVNLDQKKPAAATSPDRAAGEAVAETVPSSSSRAKRGRANATAGERPRVAKVARLPRVEEAKTQPEEVVTPTLTETCVKLISDLWSDDRNVIQKSLTDLYDVADGNADEGEISRLGGHMAIVQVLKNNLEDVLIQEEGIAALEIFENMLVGDIGGVVVILAGMRQHPGAVMVQSRGCFTIRELLNKTKPNAARFEESDGIALVIAAMKAHPHEEYVQWYGCRALLAMCEWAEYRPLICAAGGAVTIANVNLKYSDNPDVHEASRLAILKLMEKA
jgi:hypothetical protein